MSENDIERAALESLKPTIRELVKLRSQELLAERRAAEEARDAGARLEVEAAELLELARSRTVSNDELQKRIDAAARLSRIAAR